MLSCKTGYTASSTIDVRKCRPGGSWTPSTEDFRCYIQGRKYLQCSIEMCLRPLEFSIEREYLKKNIAINLGCSQVIIVQKDIEESMSLRTRTDTRTQTRAKKCIKRTKYIAVMNICLNGRRIITIVINIHNEL